MRLTVVIPTRHRPDLAITALRSVLAAQRPEVTVLVSDNSSSAEDRERLAELCSPHASPHVRYVRPPEALPMAEHWEWARLEATAAFAPTHVVYLTDRMVFLAGALDELVALLEAHPAHVVTYNHDMVDDHRLPARLVQQTWTGQLLEISSAATLQRSARAEHEPYLPRMLNCAVPLPVFERIEARFGSVFGSVAPDMCFCFRCLAVCDSTLYRDRSLIVHYATGRSNGATYARGLPSADNREFEKLAAAVGRRHGAAPEPRFETQTNAVVHEYCFVREEVGNGRFPPVDRSGYLAANDRDVRGIENAALRARMDELMREHGWGTRQRLRVTVALGVSVIRYLVRHPSAILPMARRQLWERPPGTLGALLLGRLGLSARAGSDHRFDTAAEAISFAETHARRRSAAAWHLHSLEEIPGAMRPVEGYRDARA
jgi:hypothetical protein